MAYFNINCLLSIIAIGSRPFGVQVLIIGSGTGTESSQSLYLAEADGKYLFLGSRVHHLFTVLSSFTVFFFKLLTGNVRKWNAVAIGKDSSKNI